MKSKDNCILDAGLLSFSWAFWDTPAFFSSWISWSWFFVSSCRRSANGPLAYYPWFIIVSALIGTREGCVCCRLLKAVPSSGFYYDIHFFEIRFLWCCLLVFVETVHKKVNLPSIVWEVFSNQEKHSSCVSPDERSFSIGVNREEKQKIPLIEISSSVSSSDFFFSFGSDRSTIFCAFTVMRGI